MYISIQHKSRCKSDRQYTNLTCIKRVYKFDVFFCEKGGGDYVKGLGYQKSGTKR